MKCGAKKQLFHSCSWCLFNKEASRTFDIGHHCFQGWAKRRRPVWINESHLEELCQAPPPPWCPGESEDLLFGWRIVQTTLYIRFRKWRLFEEEMYTLPSGIPGGRGHGAGGLTLEFAGFVLELFLWTLETFHLCIWMLRFKGLFLYAQIHPSHQFLTIS